MQIFEEIEWVAYHVFNDASEKAYGSVVYQWSFYISGFVSTQLVVSNSRVAPLKKSSIPKLELLSASLGIKLLKKSLMCVKSTWRKWHFGAIV